MVTDLECAGPRLKLRLVTPGDADFIHALRTDPRYAEHLSPVTGSVEDQRAWIEAYKAREAAGEEYYFIIQRRDDGRACGTVRLYGIDGDRFTWGSWILDENKPSKAALESAVLIYEIGFERLSRERAVFDVRKDNEHTLAFHRRFGAIETGQDDENVYFELPRAEFSTIRDSFMTILEGPSA